MGPTLTKGKKKPDSLDKTAGGARGYVAVAGPRGLPVCFLPFGAALDKPFEEGEFEARVWAVRNG